MTLVEIMEHGFFASQQSKCLCIIEYFDRLAKAEKNGDEDFLKRCITIERKVLSGERKSAFWSDSDKSLSPFTVNSESLIGDAHGCLQADFANEFIGGGVLQQGNVQVRQIS